MMNQENNNLDEGACGGNSHVDDAETSVKHVPGGFYGGVAGIPTEDGRPLLSGEHDIGSPDNTFPVDVDLTNDRGNQEMARKCNKTYMVEKAFEPSKTPAMLPMPMNIPVPDECKKEHINLDRLTMAERQTSFQTMHSGAEGYFAMSLNSEDNTQVNGKVTSPGRDAVVTSLTSTTPGFPMGNGTDNNNNGNSSVRSMTPNNLALSQQSNTSNTSGSSNATSGSRHSQRQRSRITDDTLVMTCPLAFITLLGTHFDGKGGSNWEVLLGHYHWNFRDIMLFGNKHHPKGYFCSILEESDFQEYTVGKLRDDLDDLPKKDTLKHINEWIEIYNNCDTP